MVFERFKGVFVGLVGTMAFEYVRFSGVCPVLRVGGLIKW